MAKPLTLIALFALCLSAGVAQAQVTLTDTPGTAIAIPDGSRTGLSRTLTFGATTDRIRSFRLDLRVTHGDDDQLDIFLIPPWATWAGPYTLVDTEFSAAGNIQNAPFPRRVIELSTDNRGGGNGDDYGSGNPPGAITYARFSATGDPINPATQAITAGGRPFTANVYFPEGVDAMEDVYGRSPAGAWTLVIADDTVGSTGTLVSWRISYTAEASGSLSAHLGAANDPGAPIVRGQAGQVLGQFRLDAVGVGTTVTSITFRESVPTNLNTLLTATSLYRDVNGDGLLDGGDVLLATAVPAASADITFAISQAIAANAGVDLLLVGTVIAAPAPISMQMGINAATSISSALVETGLFPRRAGPRPFVTATTFTSRPDGGVLIVDNTDTGITNTITVPATANRINSLRIGVRLNHTYSADLDLYLLPPGVTWAPPYATPFNGPVLTAPPGAIELSTDNNGSGDHFGANLTNYTYNYARFSGATDPTWPAATTVVGQAAPFTGAAQYRPEGLTAFNLLYAGNPGGTWTLIAVDAWENDVGYLTSWQIEYVPVTTAQFWVNAGEQNNPGLSATTGTAGNVFGQLKLEAFNTAATVSQVIARETNGFTIGGSLSALSLYRDNNSDGLFDVGDTFLVAGTLAGTSATFNLAPALSLPINTGAKLLLVGTVLGTPANTVLAFQLTTAADVTSVPAEIAPYAVQLGPHPLYPPYTYVSTPPGGIAIPDNTAAGITNTITIPATSNIIGALRIGVRIDHANDQDLDIWLIPPGVTWAGPYTTINNGANVAPPAGVIELSTDNGGTGNNYGSGSPSFVYTAFSRNGDRRFNTGASTIAGGAAAFVAASGYQPEDTVDFNILYGEQSQRQLDHRHRGRRRQRPGQADFVVRSICARRAGRNCKHANGRVYKLCQHSPGPEQRSAGLPGQQRRRV